MNSPTGEISSSVNLRTNVGLFSSRGNISVHGKARGSKGRSLSGSPENHSVYSLKEHQLANKRREANLHQLVARTSGSDVCLPEVYSRQRPDVSPVLASNAKERKPGHGFKYGNSQYGKTQRVSQTTNFSDDGLMLEGLELGSLVTNVKTENLIKQRIELREYKDVTNRLWKGSQVGDAPDTEKGQMKNGCWEESSCLNFSEDRLRTGDACSAREYSNNRTENLFPYRDTNVENHEFRGHKSLSRLHERKRDLLKQKYKVGTDNYMKSHLDNKGDLYSSLRATDGDYRRPSENQLNNTFWQSVCTKPCADNSKYNQDFTGSYREQKAFQLIELETKVAAYKKQTKKPQSHDSPFSRQKLLSPCCDRTTGETSGTDKNFSYSQNLGESGDMASKQALLKQRLWEQTIREESTVSGDTLKDLCRSPEETDCTEYPAPGSRHRNSPKRACSLSNSDRATVVQMSRRAQKQSSKDWGVGDWNWKKNFRHCSACLHKKCVVYDDENTEDMATRFSRLRANVYGVGSSLDTLSISSEEDAAGESIWTCTKWTDENSEEPLQESNGSSQWAYEVYSNTHQGPPRDVDHTRRGHAGNKFEKASDNTCVYDDNSDEHMSPRKRKNNNYRCSPLTSCPLFDRESCSLSGKFNVIIDGHHTVRTLLNSREISVDCLKLQAEERTRVHDHAVRINNKLAKNHKHRSRVDKQETAGNTNTKSKYGSLEKDTSSHNAKGARADQQANVKLVTAVEVDQGGDKCFQGDYDVRRLLRKKHQNDKICCDRSRTASTSPRQTANSVDEKLVKTVHSIKEDIEDVLQMLGSLDPQDEESGVIKSLVNSTPSTGRPYQLTNVNCATDYVKKAFNKLISFKDTFVVKMSEDDDPGGRAYDEYKRAREDYIAYPEEDEYDIENIFFHKNKREKDGKYKPEGNYIPTHYHEKVTHGKTPRKQSSASTGKKAARETVAEKTNTFDKVNNKRKGSRDRDTGKHDVETGHRSSIGLSQPTASATSEPAKTYNQEVIVEPAESRKKTNRSVTSRLRETTKNQYEDNKQPPSPDVVLNQHRSKEVKDTGAGDRAALALVASKSRPRKSSSSPPTHKNTPYAYGHYPLPTLLYNTDNVKNARYAKKHMKVQVQRVQPRKKSPEKDERKSPNSKTSKADIKDQKGEKRAARRKSEIKRTESEFKIIKRRTRSSRSADCAKSSAVATVLKSKTPSPKKETKQEPKSAAALIETKHRTSPKPQRNVSPHKLDGKKGNTPPTNSESSPKITSEDISDTAQTVKADTAESVTQEGPSGTEAFVDRYTVVSGSTETPTQGDQTTKDQSGQTKTPDVAGPETLAPSPGRRKKRLCRRTRSRSRSRTKRRKKRKLVSGRRAGDTTRFSSSDTSLLKKSVRRTRNKRKQSSEPHEATRSEFLRLVPRTKEDPESFCDSSTWKSPTADVPQSDIDDAIADNYHHREDSVTEDKTNISDAFGISTNTTVEIEASPRVDGNEGSVVHSATPANISLVNARQKKPQSAITPSADLSTSELNVSIQKLYEEISKLRMQLEASVEEAMSHPIPRVGNEDYYQFARSYKVFRELNPKIIEPVSNIRHTFDTAYSKMPHMKSELSNPQPKGPIDKPKQTEHTLANYDRIGEYMNDLECRIRNFQSSEAHINNSILLSQLDGITESCMRNSQEGPKRLDNAPPSCASQEYKSMKALREQNITTWLSEDVYDTATGGATDNSDAQNEETDKFETAPSDNDCSSLHYKDAKHGGKEHATTAAGAGSSVNNNMRPTEIQACPGVATRNQRKVAVEKCAHSCMFAESARSQNMSTAMYEVSSGDVDKTTEQHHYACFESSETTKARYFLELCSETSHPPKNDKVCASFLPGLNTYASGEPRLRGHSFTTWETIATTALQNTSQNKGSTNDGEMVEKTCIHLQNTPDLTADSRGFDTEDADLESAKSVPFLVKYVKGIFLGSAAAVSVTPGSSPRIQAFHADRKRSPREGSSKTYRKTSKKDPSVSGSDVEEISLGGYIKSGRGERRQSKPQQSYTMLDTSPKINNYLCTKQKLSKGCGLHSRTQLAEGNDQTKDSLLGRSIDWSTMFHRDIQRAPTNVVVSCGMNSEGATLMSRNMSAESQFSGAAGSYAPVQPQIVETDKIMSHYSDAINGRSSKRLQSRPLSRTSVLTVSKQQDVASDKSKTSVLESERSCLKTHHGSSNKSSTPKTYSVDKGDSDLGKTPRSSMDISEFVRNKEGFIDAREDTSSGENSIIASFENMIQQRRPYYVEHCGCRQKKRDTIIDQYDLDRYDGKAEIDGFEKIKATFQVVTVANDNNSSFDLIRNTATLANALKNESDELDEDFCHDTRGGESMNFDAIVAPTADLDNRGAFWLNDDDVSSSRSTAIGTHLAGTKVADDVDIYYSHVKDNEETSGIDYSLSLLKAQPSNSSVDEEEEENEEDDTRFDEASNANDTTLLESDEAKSWHRTTDEESEAETESRMKKSDNEITTDDNGRGKSTYKEVIDDEDDQQLEMSDDDNYDDNFDDYDYDE